MKKKTLYILLESQVRELHSLIMLSVYAAKRGFRVYIGDSFSILEIIKKKKSKPFFILESLQEYIRALFT